MICPKCKIKTSLWTYCSKNDGGCGYYRLGKIEEIFVKLKKWWRKWIVIPKNRIIE